MITILHWFPNTSGNSKLFHTALNYLRKSSAGNENYYRKKRTDIRNQQTPITTMLVLSFPFCDLQSADQTHLYIRQEMQFGKHIKDAKGDFIKENKNCMTEPERRSANNSVDSSIFKCSRGG